MKKRTQYFIAAILAVLLYGNTISNEYSMDDDFVIYRNETVQKGIVQAFNEIITSHYSTTEKSKYEYRPVVKLTFAAEVSLWGNKPHVSHAINLLLFILTILLVFNILWRLFGATYPWLPLLATLLFAAHPIHTEVVASLKNRDELLAFLFAMCSTWCFLKFADKQKIHFLILAVLAYFMAYFSKSSALVFVVLIPLILYFAGVKNVKHYIMIFLLVAAAAWLARWIPRQLLTDSHRAVWEFENPLYGHRGILFRFGTGLVALLFYLRLLIIPYPLRFYYGYDTIPLTHFPDWLSVVSLLIHIALLVTAIVLFKKKHPLSFAILFYLVAISMFSNIVRPAVGIVAERYIYAASLGFCLALAFGILKLFRYESAPLVSWTQLNKGVRLFTLILLLVFGARTISRNSVWENHLTLYYNDIDHCSQSFKANFLLASTLQAEVAASYNNPKFKARNDKYLLDADRYYRQALTIYDQYANAWNSLGSLRFMFFRDYEESILCFRRALALDPGYTEAYYNLGFTYEKKELPDSAIKYLTQAIATNNQYEAAWNELGQSFLLKKDTGSFLSTQEKMKKQLPVSASPYINLGNFYVSSGDTLKAFENWKTAAGLSPDNLPLLLNLANYYERQGNIDEYNHYMQLYQAADKKQRDTKRNR